MKSISGSSWAEKVQGNAVSFESLFILVTELSSFSENQSSSPSVFLFYSHFWWSKLHAWLSVTVLLPLGRISLVGAVLLWVQTMVWLPLLGICYLHTDADACDCTLGLDHHHKTERVCTERWSWETSFAALGSWCCISSVHDFIKFIGTQWVNAWR